MLAWIRKRKRKGLRAKQFPAAWVSIIERNVPYYQLLPAPDRQELQGHIQVFLYEKRFDGCGGMVITDEVRVTIAAQACMLLLHRETDYYPLLRTILVYPRAFRSRTTSHDGDFVQEGVTTRTGESWYRGEVILSWEDVKWGAADIHDGQNVVFHEFAHQLDDESVPADGAPELGGRSQYIAWARVLGHEFEALTRAVAEDQATVLDAYGAESPAEFFAVATECFFERPLPLRSQHPALYEQLQAFYRQDPAAIMRDLDEDA